MKFFAALVSAMTIVPAAFAQHETVTVSPESSEVRMKLNTTHEVVNGTFHVQSGSIVLDRSASQLSGVVIVAANSGNTGNNSRDKKMDKDILKVEQYTTVAFAPKVYTGAIAASGDSTIQVSGTFTLLGTPHELTIPMMVHLQGSKATVKAHFLIPYVQWGLKNPSFLIWKADNDVAIDLNLAGQVAP